MQTAIVTILIFGILISVHEFGHFITAKLSGMRVEEFSIGFGPRIYSVQKGETKYSLSLLPIGGYVRVTGESNEEWDDSELALEDSRRYQNRPVWQRVIFCSAGSFMNFLTAIIIFAGMFMVLGVPVANENPDNIITGVVDNGPAAQAGLMAGDKVVKIDGEAISNWEQLQTKINTSQGAVMAIEIERNGQAKILQIQPSFDETNQKMMLGILKDTYLKQSVGVFEAIKLSLEETYQITGMMVEAVKNLVTGQSSISDEEEGLTGPVGIVQIIGDTAEKGMLYIWNLTAILSINLGLLNILPIPALDGSKLVFLAIEAVRGKPVDSSKENLVHLFGFALLMTLMIFVTYKDIVRLFT